MLEVALQTQLAEFLWLPLAAGSSPAEPLDPVTAAAENGGEARELAERHVERNLRHLTALRLGLPTQP